MKKAKVAKKSTTGGRVSKKPVKTVAAKVAASAKASAKASVKPLLKAAPAVKAPPKKATKAAAAQASEPPKAVKKVASPAKAEPTKVVVAHPERAKPSIPAATEPKPAQRVPATKLSLKMSAKMNGAAKKAPKKTRAQKLEELGIDKSNQLSQKWSGLFRKTQDVEAKPYNMREAYEAKTPILHKLLGWGYILSNKNDRLEVLFKDGIRFLISNYKA